MQEKIQNAELLIDIFGKFPTFHDAEVAEIILKRKDKVERCSTFEALIIISNYRTGDRFLVNLIFKNIFGLKLENFNHQNVLGGLYITEFSEEFFENTKHDKRLLGVVSEAEIEKLKCYVKFEYCFGIEAEFLCNEIIVDSVRSLETDKFQN